MQTECAIPRGLGMNIVRRQQLDGPLGAGVSVAMVTPSSAKDQLVSPDPGERGQRSIEPDRSQICYGE
jgi:hypothetical protein